MRKTDNKAFMEFMQGEGVRYQREITGPEILTWFETFPRVTLEDFKAAWEQHRKGQYGGRFPTPNDLLRLTKTAGVEAAARDWRCFEEVGSDRCGYPGGINVGWGAQCAAHYRLRGTSGWSEAASLQIIQASREYQPPKSAMELMERGAVQRQASGERWRAIFKIRTAARLPADAIAPSLPAKPEHGLEAPTLDDANRAAQLAAEEASL